MTNQEIHNICEKYAITDYSINSDGSIDVVGSVYLFSMNLDKLPLKFNIVHGHFYCYKNELTSLEGSPKKVDGNFYCSLNKLTSLVGGPKEVCGTFYCSSNNLTSLEGLSKIIKGEKMKIIVIEGCDGVGKSTAVENIKRI